MQKRRSGDAMFRIFSSIILLISLRAHAQDWAEPYVAPSTLGAALESRFGLLLSNCGVQIPMKKNVGGFLGKPKLTDPLSSIPNTLQKNLALSTPVTNPIAHSAGQLFAYVYTPPETLGSPVLDSTRLIAGRNYTQDPVEMLPDGGSSIIYSSSCSSVINAAANASTGWTVPLASAKAALASDYGASTKSQVALTQGEFHSPLAILLGSPAPSDKLFASFLIWLWYTNHPTDVGKPLLYLTSFRGVALYSLSSNQTKLDGSISLSGSVSSPFASVSTSFADTISQQTSTTVTDNYSYVFAPQHPTDQWGLFAPLPTSTDLAGSATLVSAQKTSTTSILAKGIPHVHTQMIIGIPNEFCSADQWTTDYAANQGKLTITGAATGIDATSANKLPTCTFTLAFLPADTLFTGIPQVIALSFSMKLKSTISGNSLAISASPLALSPSNSPDLHLSNYTPRWQVESQSPVPGTPDFDNHLLWQASYQVVDSGDPISNANPSASVTMSCPGNISPIMNATTAYDDNSKVVTVSLRTIAYAATTNVDAKNFANFVNCTISGSLGFVMANPADGSRQVPKPIGDSITLQFPAAKPQTPPPIPVSVTPVPATPPPATLAPAPVTPGPATPNAATPASASPATAPIHASPQ